MTAAASKRKTPPALRILHVLASPGPGGAETLVRDLAAELRAMGHVAGIAFISHAEQVGNSGRFEAEFLSQLERASVPVLHIGHAARRNPLYGAWKLHSAIKGFSPDILHLHLQWALVYRLLIGPFAPAGMRTVYTHHINRFRQGAPLFRLLARPVDGFVAISGFNRALLESQVKRPVAYVPNAVAVPDRLKAKRRRQAHDPLQVLSVGQMTEQKDYPTLVEAAALVFRQRPQLAGKLVFRIAGDGPERGRVQSLVRERGLEDRVILLGTRTDVPDLMGQSDVLLMTSAYEGLPVTLLEALHAGLPIIATAVGACPEVVGDGDNGFLAPPGDPQAIAAHILALVDEPALVDRLGARSAERAAEYGIARCAERHLEFYRQLLRSKGR